MNDLHVVFGTGPLGLAVMRELRRYGKRVRMINRSSRVRFEKHLRTHGIAECLWIDCDF